MTKHNRRDFLKGALAGIFGAILTWLSSFRVKGQEKEGPIITTGAGRMSAAIPDLQLSYVMSVDPASDDPDGSQENPYATISHALDHNARMILLFPDEETHDS